MATLDDSFLISTRSLPALVPEKLKRTIDGLPTGSTSPPSLTGWP